jgi:hypothetical protein
MAKPIVDLYFLKPFFIPHRVHLVIIQELTVKIRDIIVATFETDLRNRHLTFNQQPCSFIKSEFFYKGRKGFPGT